MNAMLPWPIRLSQRASSLSDTSLKTVSNSPVTMHQSQYLCELYHGSV